MNVKYWRVNVRGAVTESNEGVSNDRIRERKMVRWQNENALLLNQSRLVTAQIISGGAKATSYFERPQSAPTTPNQSKPAPEPI